MSIAYTYKEFKADLNKIQTQITLSEEKFDYIVALSRGGLVAGVFLSHRLGIPMRPLEWSADVKVHNYWIPQDIQMGQKILFVDDLVDSGRSLTSLFKSWDNPLAPLNTNNIRVATLLNNTDVERLHINPIGPIQCDYYGTAFSRETQPEFYDFFWETE